MTADRDQHIPACAFLLADHLDAALAAGEDVLKESLAPAPFPLLNVGMILDRRRDQRSVLERIRTFELTLFLRLTRAREHAATLGRIDERFKAVANLFVAGTAQLLDAMAECGDSTNADFETGDGLLAYLRSRALVDESAAQIEAEHPIIAHDGMLIAARLPLGVLLELVRSFLDVLELHLDLYGDGDADAAAAAA